MPGSLRKVYGYQSGPNSRVMYFRESDSQTFKTGDPLKMIAATGKVSLFATDTNTVASTATDMLVGIALADGRNTTDPGQRTGAPDIRDVPVLVFDDELLLRLPIYDATASTDAQYQDVLVGTTCCIKNISGVAVASLDDTSNPTLMCVALDPGIGDTETYAAAWWRVIAAERALG